MSSNSHAISGHAVHKLSEIMSSEEFPLLSFFSSDMRPAFFENIYFSDPVVYQEEDNTVTNLILFYEGVIQLQLPTTDAFRFLIGGTSTGWNHVSASVALGSDPYLIIRDFTAALQLTDTILEDVESGDAAAIYISGDMCFSTTGVSFSNVTGATLNSAYLLGTRLIISATHILPRFDPMSISMDTLDDVAFLGLDILQLQMTVPLDFLTLPGDSSITFQLDSVSISERGFTGRVSLQGDELDLPEGGSFKNLPIRFREIAVDVYENQFIKLFAGLDLRLAFLENTSVENWISVDFGLGSTQVAKARLLSPINFEIIGSDYLLTLDNLEATGVWSDNGISFDGQASGRLELAEFDIALEQTAFHYDHSDTTDNIVCGLKNLTLGSIGQVSEADFHLTLKTHEEGQRELHKFFIRADLQWSDIAVLIPADIPELGLPDEARIRAEVSWVHNVTDSAAPTKVVVEFFTELSHLDDLWGFLPLDFRPEVENVQSFFRVTYESMQVFTAATPDQTKIHVELSSKLALKLPAVIGDLDIPGLDLFDIRSGDEQGLLSAEYRADFQTNDNNEVGFTTGLIIENPIAIDVSLPGARSAEPFITTSITKMGMQIGVASDNNTGTSTGNVATDSRDVDIGGSLLCEGDFEFRPLIPTSFPFADQFNSLLRNVGFDNIKGSSKLALSFQENSFDLILSGEFDDFGIEIDIFELISSLSTSNERPESEEFEIDFDIGFQLIGFSFKVGTRSDSQDSEDGFYFEFKLKVEATMTGLPPLGAAITLSSEEFSFGLENLTIPLEVPKYPIDNTDLARLQGGDGIWSSSAQTSYETELDGQIHQLDQQLVAPDLTPRNQFRLLKDKSHLELKRLMLQLVMLIHRRVGPGGQPVYQSLVEVDTWVHATALGLLHFETELKLHFPEIKFKIPFDAPNGISMSGTGHIVGFAPDDPLKPLEDYLFTLGLSSEYIFCKIESTGEPIPLPSFGTKYDDGSISISKFMIGYGFTKNSFAMDFAGEVVIPTELVNDVDTSDEVGIGVRFPRYNKLAFKLDLIPISIGKAKILLPIPTLDLDLRSPVVGLPNTARCEPYWDGLELEIRGVIHADFKRIAFSLFFGFANIPNYKYDGDLKLGDDANGLTLIIDNLLILSGAFLPVGFILYPIPGFASPIEPYFRNVCTNVRVLGFEINFNMQRPFPSASPLALFEVFGLIGNPLMEIDPHGSLANTIRFTLSDAYVQVPDFILQMFPDTANAVNQRYGFTLNLGTLITMAQSVVKAVKPVADAVSGFFDDQSASQARAASPIIESFDPWEWIALLPPELRKFRTGGQIAGFEASACLVIATGEEAREALTNKNAPKTDLPALTIDHNDDQNQFVTYSKEGDPLLTPTNGHQFQTSWTQEGVASGQWQETEEGIAQTETVNGMSYFIHNTTSISKDFSVTVKISHAVTQAPAAAGIIFCYVDTENHYVLRILLNSDGTRDIVVERRKSNTITRIGAATIPHYEPAALLLELTTCVHKNGRTFFVDKITTANRRGQGPEAETFVDRLVTVQEDEGIEQGKIGLYVRNQSAHFSEMVIRNLIVETGSFGQIDSAAAKNGFSVNLPAPRLSSGRVINQDESTTLFKGIEFKKFDEQHLSLIPVNKLEHVSAADASIYVGAYIKIFAGQRFRFLGRMFADGSFALVSEAESKPLQLSVLGIPVKLPFSGYGNLMIAGRQKRNGYYGYVEANGYFDWSPIPNIVRIQVGDQDQPASLQLHSSGQFSLAATTRIDLFNGAATVTEGSVAITEQQASFDGQLAFVLGFGIDEYRFPEVLAMDIAGAGSIEGVDRFQFRGRGDVRFLGESFSSVHVDVDEQHAYFDVRFKKPVASGSALEKRFPILSSCDVDLRGSCKFRMRRTVRPEFRLAGEGHIKVLGAEIHGKGEMSSLPNKNQSLKKDVFHASIDGNLFWQGRKWLGGKISVGSTGLQIYGTTNLGLELTPSQVGPIKIASLFLNIQLDGEFKLDAEKAGLYFLFRGHWTLGASIADTGNSDNRQILPLASSEFTFSSNATIGSVDQYCLSLFHIDGFAFMPFKAATVPVPSISLEKASGATTVIKSGKLKDFDPPVAAVEFHHKLFGDFGVKSGFPPIPYAGSEDFDTENLGLIYSAYTASFNASKMTVDFEELGNIQLALCLDNDANKNFPLRLKVISNAGTKYFP